MREFDSVKAKAEKFIDNYSIYLPNRKEIHENFGADLGELIAFAMEEKMKMVVQRIKITKL